MPTARAETRIATAGVFLCGLVSAFLVPPGQTPDEGYSFLRSCHVADGHLSLEPVEGWGGGCSAPGANRIVEASSRLTGHPEEKFTPNGWRELAALDWDGEPRAIPFLTAAPYSFVPFLPQAAGIRIGRGFGLGPLGAFYCGRIANLAFGTFLVFIALSLAPVGRRFLALVAMLPMTVHLFGSHAPEVGVIGAALVVPAVVLRIALAERPARWRELALIAAAAAWIAACKPPYLPIIAFVLVIPASRFGGVFHRAVFVGILSAASAGIAFASVTHAKHNYPDPHTFFGHEASVRAQTEHVKQHPGQFLRDFSTGLIEHGVPTWFRLFKLGWLDVTIDPVAVVLCSIVLLLMACAARSEIGDRLVPRWPASLVVLGGLFLTSLSLYIWCAPVGGSDVPFHGRYLLPLLPAAVFLAPARMPSALAMERNQRLLCVLAAGAMAVISLASVLVRYWVAWPLLHLTS